MSPGVCPVVRIIGLPERWRGDQLEGQLDGAGLDVRRVFGVRPDEVFDGRRARDWADQRVARWTIRRTLTPGEVGCALAHLRAQREAAIADEEWSLVMEDDARLTRPLHEVVEVVEWARNHGSSGPTVVLLSHLGAIVTPEPVAVLRGKVLQRAVVPPDGAACYLVNRQAARLFAEQTLPVVGPADWPPRCAGSVDYLVVTPRLAVMDGGAESVIGERPGDAWPAATRPWRTLSQVCHLAWPLLRGHLSYTAYLSVFLRYPLARRMAGRETPGSPLGLRDLPRWLTRVLLPSGRLR